MFTRLRIAWRDLPLDLKMTALIAVFVITAMGPLVALVALTARDEISAAVRAQSLQRARGTAQVLDTYLAHTLEDVKFLGTTPNVVEFLRAPDDPAARAKIAQSIAQMRAIYTYDALLIADASGTIGASTHAPALGRRYTTAPFFRSAIAGQTQLDVPRYDAYDQQVFLHFSAPIRDERGIILGAMIGRLTMSALDQIIAADTNFAGRGDYGVLADDLGIRLAHATRPDLRFKPLAPLNPDVANTILHEQRFGPATEHLLATASHNPELVTRAKLLLYDRTTDPYVTFTSEAAGPAFAALAPLTQQRWVYSIRTPEARIQAAVNEQITHLVASALLVSAVAIFAAFIAAHWITRHLRAVTQVAHALAAGDTTRRARLNRNDEVGQMANAFDAMADALIEKENQLRAYADELETRVAARTAELRERETRLRQIVQSTAALLVNVDRRGKFTYVNEAAIQLLEASPEEMIGTSYLDFIHPDDRARVQQFYTEQIAARRAASTNEFRIVTPSGKVRWLRFAANLLIENDTMIGQSGVALDITERKQHERELHAISTLANALRAAMTRAEIVPIVLEQVMNLMNAPGANLTRRDPVTGEIIVELARGMWARATGIRMNPQACVAGHVIATGKPYLSNDAPNDPLLFRPDYLGKVGAFACVPLIAQDEMLGALWVGRLEPISDEEMRLLTALADIAASALRRAALYEETTRLYEQTQRNVQRLTTLHAIDQAIGASLDLPLVLRVLLDQIVTSFHADAADVLLFEPQTHALRLAAARGLTMHALEQRSCRLGTGLAGTLALERRVMYIPHLATRNDLSPRERALQQQDLSAYCGAPLVAKGQLKGVLELFFRQPPNLPDDWQDWVNALALQAALAIDNLSLFEKWQRSTQDLALAVDTMIQVWARTLEQRGYEPPGHLARVAEMTERLARAVGIPESELPHLQRGALLHDIGKFNIPESILSKSAPLTELEEHQVRQHPTYAQEMLAPIEFLKPALAIPYCHHEHWDGSGYPRGLQGEAIPLAARVFAVVDAWDTVRAPRPYAEAWDDARARAYLREQAGKQFDPYIVETFLRLVGDLIDYSTDGLIQEGYAKSHLDRRR